MKCWIATYVDYGETCDGKPRVLDVCKSRDEAIAVVHNDMNEWIDKNGHENVNADFNKMSVSYSDSDICCEWNISEFDVE